MFCIKLCLLAGALFAVAGWCQLERVQSARSNVVSRELCGTVTLSQCPWHFPEQQLPPESSRPGPKVSICFIKYQLSVNKVLRSFPLFLNEQIRAPWMGSIAVRDTSFEFSAPKKKTST